MAGTVTIGGFSMGTAGRSQIGPITLQGNITCDEVLNVPLSEGDNSIAVPAGSLYATIVFPVGNSVTVTVRTNSNSGDQGLPLGAPLAAVFPLAGGVTTLILKAAGITEPLEISFI